MPFILNRPTSALKLLRIRSRSKGKEIHQIKHEWTFARKTIKTCIFIVSMLVLVLPVAHASQWKKKSTSTLIFRKGMLFFDNEDENNKFLMNFVQHYSSFNPSYCKAGKSCYKLWDILHLMVLTNDMDGAWLWMYEDCSKVLQDFKHSVPPLKDHSNFQRSHT